MSTGFFAWVVDASDEDYTGWVLYKYNGGDPTLLASYDFVISQDVFDRFVAELRAGPVEQSEIDAKPERWKRICVETGLLRREGERFVQHIRKPDTD